MLPILNPSVQGVEESLAPTSLIIPLGQKCHSAKLTNPLLTFFNYANLDDLRAVVNGVKHAVTAAV